MDCMDCNPTKKIYHVTNKMIELLFESHRNVLGKRIVNILRHLKLSKLKPQQHMKLINVDIVGNRRNNIVLSKIQSDSVVLKVLIGIERSKLSTNINIICN